MPAKREVVAREAAEIDIHFTNRLKGVAVVEQSSAPAKGGDFCYWEKDPRFIVGPHEGDQRGIVCNGIFQVFHRKKALVINRQVGNTVAVVLFKKLRCAAFPAEP